MTVLNWRRQDKRYSQKTSYSGFPAVFKWLETLPHAANMLWLVKDSPRDSRFGFRPTIGTVCLCTSSWPETTTMVAIRSSHWTVCALPTQTAPPLLNAALQPVSNPILLRNNNGTASPEQALEVPRGWGWGLRSETLGALNSAADWLNSRRALSLGDQYQFHKIQQ